MIGRIGLILAITAFGDTVTTRDARSCNGTVTVDRGVVRLNARFPGGSQTLQYGNGAVRAIEINSTTFNAGAAPKLPPPAPANLSVTVYLTDKTGHRCNNLSIQADGVSCSAGSWARQNVLRIIFDQ